MLGSLLNRPADDHPLAGEEESTGACPLSETSAPAPVDGLAQQGHDRSQSSQGQVARPSGEEVLACIDQALHPCRRSNLLGAEEELRLCPECPAVMQDSNELDSGEFLR